MNGRLGRAALGLAAIVIMLGPLARPQAQPAEMAMPQELRGFKPAEAGKAAPDIKLTDQTEQPVSLSSFHGRLVLINFWATWCEPCVREMPALDALQTHFADQPFTVLAVSQDRGGLPVVRKWYDQHGLDGLDLYSDARGEAGRAFGIRGLPTSILVARDGTELGRIEGAVDWDSPAVAAEIEKLLKQGDASKS